MLYLREDTVVVTGQLLMEWESDRVPRSSSALEVQMVFPSMLVFQQQPESLKHTRPSIEMSVPHSHLPKTGEFMTYWDD